MRCTVMGGVGVRPPRWYVTTWTSWPRRPSASAIRWMRIGVPRGQGNGQAATIAIRIDALDEGARQAPVAIRKPLQQADCQARNATRADGDCQRQRPALQYQPITRDALCSAMPALNAQPRQLVPPGPQGPRPIDGANRCGQRLQAERARSSEDRGKNEQRACANDLSLRTSGCGSDRTRAASTRRPRNGMIGPPSRCHATRVQPAQRATRNPGRWRGRQSRDLRS